MPEITEQVVIDASTQAGYAGMPLVQLDGALAGNNNGLVIRAGGSTVRGLAIVRFNGAGITLSDCDNNLVQGNHIGVDAAGSVKRANFYTVSILAHGRTSNSGTIRVVQ